MPISPFWIHSIVKIIFWTDDWIREGVKIKSMDISRKGAKNLKNFTIFHLDARNTGWILGPDLGPLTHHFLFHSHAPVIG